MPLDTSVGHLLCTSQQRIHTYTLKGMMIIITPHAVDGWNDLLCPSLSVLLLNGLN